MKASVIYRYGGPEEFRYESIPDPVAGVGEALIRVAAVGVNPVDALDRSGGNSSWRPLTFPAVIGWDLSGTITALGPDVEEFSIGDKVLVWDFNTYAELCVVKASLLVKVPEGLDLVEAAALPLVTQTGSQLIFNGIGIVAGQTVLVSGGAGSVGRAAVFAAKARGAVVIAGVLKRQLDASGNIGADQVIALDDEAEINALPPMDVVANTVRGATAEILLGKVKPGGVFASATGEPAGARNYPMVKVVSFVSRPDAANLRYMAEAVANGKMVIPIGRKLPLSQAREAHMALAQGSDGKILLIP